VTIAIVLQLGESVAGVASGLADNTDAGQLAEFGAGIALPLLSDPSAVDDNIRMFKIIVSILILSQVAALSLIGTRLRGGGLTSALGQAIQLLWVAGLASLFTAIVLERATAVFGI
jgi:hypothetical protein